MHLLRRNLEGDGVRIVAERAPQGPAQIAALREAKKAVRTALRVTKSYRTCRAQALRKRALIAVLEGNEAQARRYFDESLRVADEQEARYEHAKTLLAQGEAGLKFRWPEAEQQRDEARIMIADAESFAGLDDAQAPLEALSPGVSLVKQPPMFSRKSLQPRSILFEHVPIFDQAADMRLVLGEVVVKARVPLRQRQSWIAGLFSDLHDSRAAEYSRRPNSIVRFPRRYLRDRKFQLVSVATGTATVGSSRHPRSLLSSP